MLFIFHLQDFLVFSKSLNYQENNDSVELV